MWNQLQILRKDYIRLGVAEAVDYEKFCMISIVYNSTKIEGCSLTETDTRVLLEKNITAQGKPLADHLMVQDHYNAFHMLKKYAAEKRKISTDFICEIAACVMKSTGGPVSTTAGNFDTSKGELRRAQVYVDKKYFPDYSKVSVMLKQLAETVNEQLDSVSENETLKLAADIHYNLVNIHPFGDGNGRTARLFMNYIQIYHSEPLVKIFTEDRAAYIDALNLAEEKEDIRIFQDFICTQQIKFYTAELEKFDKGRSGFNMLF